MTMIYRECRIACWWSETGLGLVNRRVSRSWCNVSGKVQSIYPKTKLIEAVAIRLASELRLRGTKLRGCWRLTPVEPCRLMVKNMGKHSLR